MRKQDRNAHCVFVRLNMICDGLLYYVSPHCVALKYIAKQSVEHIVNIAPIGTILHVFRWMAKYGVMSFGINVLYYKGNDWDGFECEKYNKDDETVCVVCRNDYLELILENLEGDLLRWYFLIESIGVRVNRFRKIEF